MISLYSGTPGSGKSFHATSDVFYRLRNKKNVITNFPISEDVVKSSLIDFWMHKLFKRPYQRDKKRKIGNYTYCTNADLTVDFLKKYAKENHVGHKEHETLVVIDECGIMFNPRTFTQADRLEWIQFFSLHRHYGYDFVLISQSDRMVDRQIRSFFEYEHKHRNVGHFKLWGKIMALLMGGSCFIDVTYFYGIREKVKSEFFRFSHRVADMYDSYLLFDENGEECTIAAEENTTEVSGGTAPGGGDPRTSEGVAILDNSNT